MKNAPTEFGPISATVTFKQDGATVALASKFHSPPAACRIRIPYFKELVRFSTDAREKRREGDCILVSPDATGISIEWRDKAGAHQGTFADLLTDYRSANRFAGVDSAGHPIIQAGKPFLLEVEKRPGPEPLSFALACEAFQHEFKRLADDAVKKGGRLLRVSAPAMLTAEERKSRFAAEYGSFSPVKNLATGCAVEASASLPDHGPELVTDGIISLESSWQADPYPQWLKLDLEKTHTLKGIQVWTYWGAGRYYRYSVEVSVDGKEWAMVGDKSTNTQPATERGDRFDFAPREARFIRLNMLYHSLNPGVHVVEVNALE